MTTFRSASPLEALLAEAASVLIRDRRRRPAWLPPGYPVKLILTQKRQLLIDQLLSQPALRRHLRISYCSTVPGPTDHVTIESFNALLAGSTNPQRLVAMALLSDDHALAELAAAWAAEPDRIPGRPVKLTPTQKDAPRDTDRQKSDEDDELAVVETTRTGDVPGVDETQEPQRAGAGAQPSGWATEHTACRAERDRLLRRIARLGDEVARLRAAIPTRRERSRQNRQRRELEQLREQVAEQESRLVALQQERDELLGIRRDLEEQLDEVEEARQRAQRKARTLETRLLSTEGRAEYLQRMVVHDLEELYTQHDQLPPGPDRTRVGKQVALLEGLQTALEQAFPTPTPANTTSSRHAVVGMRSLSVTVDPLGGGEEIGGSAILVEAAGKRILVDVGMHPSGHGPRRINEVLDGRPLDAIVLTHAHNDHAGFLPAIIDRFRTTPIYCSVATAQLLPTMWADSAKVMARSFEEAVESDEATPPHYGPAEVEQAESQVQSAPYNRRFNVGELGLTLFQAGHILGAAGLVIEAGDKRVVITGDISGLDDRYLSVEPARLPSGLVRGADLLAIETTYCDATHGDRARQTKALVDTVDDVVGRNGRVLIPAFGLGRSQEVIMLLAEQLPDVDVLVDGLAREISTIYEMVGTEAGKSVHILEGRVRPVTNRSRSMRSFHSGVVVTTSGMLTGGPAVTWALEILPDERGALLLCGYQDEEAPGRRLEELLDGRRCDGVRTLTLPDREWGTTDVPVRSEVGRYNLSAHADQRGLIDIITAVGPKATMLVHGERRKQWAFRPLLQRHGVRIVPTARLEL